MVDPRARCKVEPTRHSMDRMVDRGLSDYDLERMVRKGNWVPLGDFRFDVTYGSWHLVVKWRQCLIRVLTVFKR